MKVKSKNFNKNIILLLKSTQLIFLTEAKILKYKIEIEYLN